MRSCDVISPMHCLTSLKIVAESWCHQGTCGATCFWWLFLECLKLWLWSMRVTSKNIRDLRTCPPSSSLNPEIPEVWGRHWSEPPTSSRSWTPRPRCRWPRSSWMLEWRKTLRGARFESSIWLDGSPGFYRSVGLTLYRKKNIFIPRPKFGLSAARLLLLYCWHPISPSP